MSWIAAARTVKERHQCARVHIDTGHLVPDGRNRRGRVVLLDATTASAMVSVYDALGHANRKRFDAMPVDRAAVITWDILRRAKA